MWKLPIPDISNSMSDLEKALKPDNGTPPFVTTAEEDARILELYRIYDELNGNPDDSLLGDDLRAELLNAIHDSYELTQKTRRLKKIREDLKLSVEKCPYCGVGELTDLDHHIPKSKYKAHAIYARNLVPTCHPCNKKKSTTANQDPNFQFLHTYFGNLPAEPFFVASIHMAQHAFTATFKAIKTASMDEEEFQRLEFQIAKLELNDRYTAAVVTYLSIHKTSIEMMGDISPDVLEQWLTKAHSDSCYSFGVNHWQTALLKALADSQDFCAGGYRCAFGRRDLAI